MTASAQCGDTGQGATLTYGSTSFAVTLTKIGGVTISIDKLECSGLSTAGFKKYIPGDLKEVSDLDIEFRWNTLQAIPTIGGASETFTLTMPLRTTETTAENFAGTGFFKSITLPDLSLGEIMNGKATICFDGLTPPAITIAT